MPVVHVPETGPAGRRLNNRALAVNRAAIGADTVILQNWEPVAGDYIGFGGRYLHLVEAVRPRSTRSREIDIHPPLLAAVGAATAVECAAPMVECKAVEIHAPSWQKEARSWSGLTIEFESVR